MKTYTTAPWTFSITGPGWRPPVSLFSELANIAWKKCVRGEEPPAQARAMTAAIRHNIPTLHPVSDFAERTMEIALELNHTVYDCLYLACAEGGDTLITAYKRFHESVKTPVSRPCSNISRNSLFPECTQE